jgi:hypothetical protein
MEYHSTPLFVKAEPTSGEAFKGLIEIRGSILFLQLCEGSWVFMSSHLLLEIEARGVITLLWVVVFLPSFEVGGLSLPVELILQSETLPIWQAMVDGLLERRILHPLPSELLFTELLSKWMLLSV